MACGLEFGSGVISKARDSRNKRNYSTLLHMISNRQWNIASSDVEKANNFKSPKKVRLGPTTQQDMMGQDMMGLKLDYFILIDLGNVVQPGEADESGIQVALRDVFLRGWDRISANFVEMSCWTYDQTGLTVAANSHRKELTDYMNDVGAKTRLLSAKIGEFQEPRKKESALFRKLSQSFPMILKW